jgi:hypothetical protein
MVIMDSALLARQRAMEFRVYCPGCGTVRNREDQHLSGSRVVAHHFETGLREQEYCPGGTFDEAADRAP